MGRIGRTTMTDLNEDRTVALNDQGADRDRGGHGAGLVDVPRARLVCIDRTQVEGVLPGDGIINLVPGAEQTVGRGETCTYPIGSRKLSRQHARVFAGVGAWGVEDLNSTNGLRVNDEKVLTAWLKSGDVVRFGPIPFRFEVERPDSAAAAPRPPAPEGAEGEHTMIFTGADGARAAEVMIKAVQAAESAEETPPTIVPTTPRKSASPPTSQARGPGNRTSLLAIAAGAAVIVGVVVGGVIYYPAFQRSQEISAIVDKDASAVKYVIDRALATAGTSTDAARLDDIRALPPVGDVTDVARTPADVARTDDIQRLRPVLADIGSALNGDYADSRELADLYARSSFLVFEREFAPLFIRPDPNGAFLKEAGRKASELYDRLGRVGRSDKLPPLPVGADQDPLKTATDLADLGRTLVKFRTFSRQFPEAAKGRAQPTTEQLKAIDECKEDFTRYRRLYNQALSHDYRLFNAMVDDVEKHDIALVSSWHGILTSRP